MLAAWCITSSDRKVLLHLAVGNKESEACWTEFFHSMIARGLPTPTWVTADGAPGLKNAIDACFANSLRIRCWYHKLGNIRAKLPDEAADEFIAYCRGVRDAASPAHARAIVTEIVDTYEREFPAAVACLLDDLDASLAHLRLPGSPSPILPDDELDRAELRRGASPLEGYSPIRRRTQRDEAGLRRKRVAINDTERAQLRTLRRELGIDPPPTSGERKEGSSRERVA